MLKKGAIERAIWKWVGFVVFAPMKDEKLRFCAKYKTFIAMTVRDTHHCHGWKTELALWGMQPFSLQTATAVGTTD